MRLVARHGIAGRDVRYGRWLTSQRRWSEPSPCGAGPIHKLTDSISKDYGLRAIYLPTTTAGDLGGSNGRSNLTPGGSYAANSICGFDWHALGSIRRNRPGG